MNTIIHILDLFGTAVFATTGALSAGKRCMDIFGVIVLACVTAIGGGTLRDVVLGITPVFWIEQTEYIGIAVIAACGTYIMANRFQIPAKLLLYADALGLATFMVIGFEKGYHATQNYSIGIIMGVITGVFGGIIRDVLSGEIPFVFRKEIYASASFGGAVLLALLTFLNIPVVMALTAAFFTTFTIRCAAIYHSLSLPIFRLKDSDKCGTS